MEDQWGVANLKLIEARELMILDSWEKVRDVTAAGVPIVGRTQLFNESTGLKAVIEYPIKTMNVSVDNQLYQVDTGPIAYPDLSKGYDLPIDCLSLAYAAFNVAHFTDFVVEQPTPVIEAGVEKCLIHHYSSPFSNPARNTLLALSLPK